MPRRGWRSSPCCCAMPSSAAPRSASSCRSRRPSSRAYWRDVLEAVREARRILLAAFEGEALIGSVQLALEPRANGRHRGEVMKLMVLRSHRGRGAGRALMRALLEAARASGRSLLLLDVRTGDPAERLYRTLGFVPFGRVPGHARSPDGRLADTTFYYLQLPPARSPGKS